MIARVVAAARWAVLVGSVLTASYVFGLAVAVAALGPR